MESKAKILLPEQSLCGRGRRDLPPCLHFATSISRSGSDLDSQPPPLVGKRLVDDRREVPASGHNAQHATVQQRRGYSEEVLFQLVELPQLHGEHTVFGGEAEEATAVERGESQLRDYWRDAVTQKPCMVKFNQRMW